MAAKRSRSSRRRSTGPSVKSLSKSLTTLKRQLRSHTEVKRYNYALAAGPTVANTPTAYDLLQMPSGEGPGLDSRIGDKVTYTSCQLRLSWTTVGAGSRFRIMAVQFPQATNPAATTADLSLVLTHGAVAAGIFTFPADSYLSGYRQGGVENFRILYDRTIEGSDSRPTGTLKVDLVKKPTNVKYTQGVFEPVLGNIRLYYWSTGGPSHANVTANVRTAWTDM